MPDTSNNKKLLKKRKERPSWKNKNSRENKRKRKQRSKPNKLKMKKEEDNLKKRHIRLSLESKRPLMTIWGTRDCSNWPKLTMRLGQLKLELHRVSQNSIKLSNKDKRSLMRKLSFNQWLINWLYRQHWQNRDQLMPSKLSRKPRLRLSWPKNLLRRTKRKLMKLKNLQRKHLKKLISLRSLQIILILSINCLRKPKLRQNKRL